MVFSVYIFTILNVFFIANTLTCSDNDENSACSTAGCFWNAGICKAAPCSLPNCSAGCDYQASTPATCVDDVAVACAAIGTNEAQCAGNGTCKLTSGTCVVSAEAEKKCDVLPDAGVCPQGCDLTRTTVCEPELDTPDCGMRDPTVKVTVCTIDDICKWETTEGGKCVLKDPEIGNETDCDMRDNTELSDCLYLNLDLCTVRGSSCSMYSHSYFFNKCNSINITQETTECESETFRDCQIVEGECVKAEGGTWEGCGNLSTVPIPVCSFKASDICTIVNGECVPGFNELCEEFSEVCLKVGFCKWSDSNKCVFDVDFCESLSTDPYTECTHPWNHEACKVTTNSGTKQCQTKTPSEFCPTLSSVTYSPCELDNDCRVVDGQCVRVDDYWGNCEDLEVGKTASECTDSRTFSCEINQATGGCVPHIAQCNMNAAGTSCDEYNAQLDKCGTKQKDTCVNKNCSNLFDEDSCTNLAGCEWSDVRTCVIKDPSSCTGEGTDTCSSSGCTLVSEKSESCKSNATITNETCGKLVITKCGQSPGCAWFNTGGNCIEKSCGNSPSYALCCNGDTSCAYCAAKDKPNDCPGLDCESSPSFALCCDDDDALCAYCVKETRPVDCPELNCTNSASYTRCCSGDPSCPYCNTGTRPSDCPGIKSSGAVDPISFRAFAPALLVLTVFFIGWI